RERISKATKAALAAAKARGTKLGNPNLRPGDAHAATVARNARSAMARAYAVEVFKYIKDARKAGCISLGKIAQALTARGIRTPMGVTTWSRTQVSRVIARAISLEALPNSNTSK